MGTGLNDLFKKLFTCLEICYFSFKRAHCSPHDSLTVKIRIRIYTWMTKQREKKKKLGYVMHNNLTIITSLKLRKFYMSVLNLF